MCNIDCFSTATMVARMHLPVTIHIFCLSGLCNLKNRWRRKTRIDKTVISELISLFLRLFAENELSATTGMRVLVRLISDSEQPSSPVSRVFVASYSSFTQFQFRLKVGERGLPPLQRTQTGPESHSAPSWVNTWGSVPEGKVAALWR